MEYTLKKIIQIIEDFADAHKQVNSFGQGDIFEINTKERVQPTLWVDIMPSTNQPVVTTVNLRIYTMDLVDKDDSNELDVHSDTMLILKDTILYLRREYELIDDNETINMTPFTQNFNDDVSGWYAEVPLRVESKYGECDIPKN